MYCIMQTESREPYGRKYYDFTQRKLIHRIEKEKVLDVVIEMLEKYGYFYKDT